MTETIVTDLHGAPAVLPDRAGISDAEREAQAVFRTRYAGEIEAVLAARVIEAPRVTLVVVSYRAGSYLLRCLQQLRGQTVVGSVPYEILLADSGGLEHLRARYGTLLDIDLRLRSGLPLNVARNAAMAWARGELVAFIDDDGLVCPDWVEQAIAVFADPSVGAARGRMVPHRHPYFNAFAVHYDRGDAIWDDESLATEGNLMIRRALYMEVGGFPDQFYGAEGCCLAYRIKRAHPELRTVYAPGMIMQHDYARTAREFLWKCRRYRTTNEDATRDDAGFRDFLRRYLDKPKPRVRRPLDERAAKRLLHAAAWAIERMPAAFDRVRRR